VGPGPHRQTKPRPGGPCSTTAQTQGVVTAKVGPGPHRQTKPRPQGVVTAKVGRWGRGPDDNETVTPRSDVRRWCEYSANVGRMHTSICGTDMIRSELVHRARLTHSRGSVNTSWCVALRRGAWPRCTRRAVRTARLRQTRRAQAHLAAAGDGRSPGAHVLCGSASARGAAASEPWSACSTSAKPRASLYLVLEYVDGVSLAEVLRAVAARKRTIELGPALFMAREVAAGLAHAHEYRDDDDAPLGVVSPRRGAEQHLLGRSGEVKLTDFGIVHSAWSDVRTAPGELRGKVGYISPEQAQVRASRRAATCFRWAWCWRSAAGRAADSGQQRARGDEKTCTGAAGRACQVSSRRCRYKSFICCRSSSPSHRATGRKAPRWWRRSWTSSRRRTACASRPARSACGWLIWASCASRATSASRRAAMTRRTLRRSSRHSRRASNKRPLSTDDALKPIVIALPAPNLPTKGRP